MSDNDLNVTPPPPVVTPKSELFSKANLTLALATGAFVLALAPYVLPNIQNLIVRGGLMAGPEVLFDASTALQAKKDSELQAEAQKAIAANQAALINPDDPILGRADAAITIVEFQDYLCGFCKHAAPQLDAFIKANPDVRVVVKEYPVIRPDQSRTLAAIALAARERGKYEAVHHGLYEGELTSDADIDTVLVKAGLNPADIRTIANSPTIQNRIDQTLALGQNIGIQATPNFIIGGVLVNGADMEQVKTLVAAERSKLATK